MTMAEKNKQRVIIYIDGFNFYYGLKTAPWKKYYWLDIVKVMETRPLSKDKRWRVVEIIEKAK